MSAWQPATLPLLGASSWGCLPLQPRMQERQGAVSLTEHSTGSGKLRARALQEAFWVIILSHVLGFLAWCLLALD